MSLHQILASEGLSDGTIHVYCQIMKRYCEFNHLHYIDLELLLQPEKAIEFALSKIKPSTQKNNFISLQAIYHDVYKDERPDVTERWLEIAHKHFPNNTSVFKKPIEERMKKIDTLGFTYDKVSEVYHSLKEKLKEGRTWRLNTEFKLASLYYHLPPIRQGEYVTLTIDGSGKNNIDLENKVMIIREYKTKKHYGDRTINLPDPLVDDLLLVVNRNSKYLFQQKGDLEKHIIVNTAKDILTDIFGVSTQILRNVYVSDIVSKRPAEEREEICKIMAHSIETQMFYYSSLDENLHPQEKHEQEDVMEEVIQDSNEILYENILGVEIDNRLLSEIQIEIVNGHIKISKNI